MIKYLCSAITRSRNVWISAIAILLFSCAEVKQAQNVEYLDHVGDIFYDEKQDDAKFSLCNQGRTRQYYEFGEGIPLEGEKPKLIAAYEGIFSSTQSNQSGYITIRFVVNCHGQSDRFRIQQMNAEYQPVNFNDQFVKQILKTTKSLKGWKTFKNEVEAADYYVYLTFKITQGKITEILP